MKRHIYRNEDGFSFEAGGRVETLEVAYHTSPMEYKKGMKVIWICHALTADSNAGDWWADLVGPGKLFDTDKYFVVCGNMIDTVSRGIKKMFNEQWRRHFPMPDYEIDQIEQDNEE